MIQGRATLLEKLKIDQDRLKDLPETKISATDSSFQLEKGENPDLKGISQLVTTTMTTDKGKYLIAKEEIAVGSTLVFEKPVASVVLPKFAGSHCHHCLKRVEAPVGCSTCCGIAFCSLQCKNSAKYHRFECQLLDLIIGKS